MKNIVNLGNVATYINGYAFKPSDWAEDGTPIIRIQDLTGNSYQMNRFKGIVDSKYDVNSGDVLISWSASLGVYVWNRGNAVLNQHIFKVVFDKEEVDKDFFVFQIDNLLKRAANQAHGATMRHLTKPVFDALPFYLPDIKTQRLISSKLNLIVHLIEDHHEQLKKLDELIRSRFLEMFGDIELNSQNMQKMMWQEVFDTQTGKLDANAAVKGGRYPFFTCAKEISTIDEYAYDCEALLLAGNNAVGDYDVKYYKGKFNAYQRTYILMLKNRQYSYSVFKFQLEQKLRYLQLQSKGTNTRYLTMGILRSLDFIVPPIVKQQEFAQFVNATDKSKYRGRIFLHLLEDVSYML